MGGEGGSYACEALPTAACWVNKTAYDGGAIITVAGTG